MFKEEILQSAARTKDFGGNEILTHAGEGKIAVFKEFAGSDRNQRKKEAELIIEKSKVQSNVILGLPLLLG